MTPSHTKTAGRVGVEARGEQRGVEPVAFEVDRHVDDPAGVEAFTRDDRDLAGLRGRVVHLEGRDRARRGQAVGARVEARTEDHELVGGRRGRSVTASSMNRVRATADGRGPGPATRS